MKFTVSDLETRVLVDAESFDYVRPGKFRTHVEIRQLLNGRIVVYVDNYRVAELGYTGPAVKERD